MRIEKAGLTVKLSKSKFAKRSCEYLGYIVGGGVVKPILSKVKAISSFPKAGHQDSGQSISRSCRVLQTIHSRFRFSGSTANRLNKEIGS